MTLAIAFSTRNARTLQPDPDRVGPFFDAQQTNRPTLTNEQRTSPSRSAAIRFGAFRLLPMQRLLLEADQPVHLGSRALDILIALIERHGELVTKKELMARVWPGITVVEANLAVHVSALRRALRDGQAGNRYLINIPGQGYRFVAPISITEELPPPGSSWLPAMERDFDMRAMLAQLIGSADEVRRLAAQLLEVSDSGA
jgi:DNA-binding winged helix-turn-helix (wHTH) protein